MSYATETILRDAGGNPIPQYFHVGDDVFKALTEEEAEQMAVFLEAIKDALEGDVQTSLDAIQTAVEGTLDVRAIGSLAEYSWGSGEAQPTPDVSAIGVIVGVEVDTKTVYVWNPETTAWVEWLVL